MEFTGLTITLLGLILGFLALIAACLNAYYAKKAVNQPKIINKTNPPDKMENDVLQRIIDTKTIVVGVVHYPPLLDFNDDGKVSGLYAVMMNWVSKKNSLTTKYLPLRWNELNTAVVNNEVDVVLSIFPTRLRYDYADFGAIMHRIGVGAIALNSNEKIVDHEDLNKHDVRIAVTKGEIGWEYALNYLGLEKHPRRIIIIEEFDIKTMMGLVKSGQVDVALADSLSCFHYAATEPLLVDIFSTNPLKVCDTGIMFKKGNKDLQQWLDSNFAELRNSEKFQRKERALLQKLHGKIKSVPIKRNDLL